MIVKFDSFDRYETPNIVLCYPCSSFSNDIITDTVSEIPFTSDIEFVFNFNDYSTLNFSVYLPDKTSEYYDAAKRVYDLILKDMYLYVDEVGYFRIEEVDDTQSMQGDYKDVSASSCEIELANRSVPYIPNGTYEIFSTNPSTPGILNMLASTIPQWTISAANIDPELSGVYRTVEDLDIKRNVWDFVMNDLQDSYECIFIYDVKNRKISVYKKGNYDTDTDIHLTKEDMISSITKRVNNDTPYSAMSGYGGTEDVNMSAVNPLGINVVFDLSYFIPWMPDDLGEAVAEWMQDIADAEDDYYDARIEYTILRGTLLNKIAEKDRLLTYLSVYNRCKDNITTTQSTTFVDLYNDQIDDADAKIEIEADVTDTLNALQNLIDETESAIGDLDGEIEDIEGDVSAQEAIMTGINQTLSFGTYFSSAEYKQLVNYLYEGVYTDTDLITTDSMTNVQKVNVALRLYAKTKSHLNKLSSPTYEFDIDTDNFVFISKFSHWTEQLHTGCLINVEEENGVIRKLYATSMSVNYEDQVIKFTFCTEQTGTGAKVLFKDIFENITKSSSSIKHV